MIWPAAQRPPIPLPWPTTSRRSYSSPPAPRGGQNRPPKPGPCCGKARWRPGRGWASPSWRGRPSSARCRITIATGWNPSSCSACCTAWPSMPGWPLYPADIRAALARRRAPAHAGHHTGASARLAGRAGGHAAGGSDPLGHRPVAGGACAARPRHVSAARLIEIYGCTEAGQMATRRTAQETDWHCLDGVALHQDALGTWASGPAVAGPTLLHDVIELTGPASFRLGARAADLIDVAGKRSSLALSQPPAARHCGRAGRRVRDGRGAGRQCGASRCCGGGTRR